MRKYGLETGISAEVSGLSLHARCARPLNGGPFEHPLFMDLMLAIPVMQC